MELEGAGHEYIYYCLAKGFTKKTLINKRQEWKNIKLFLKEKRGLRAMDLRSLTYESVGETSILIHGKGNKERIAYISPALKKVLVRYERIRIDYVKDRILKEDAYFLSYQGQGLSYVSLDKVIKEAGERAGVKGKRISPHTFRHYFVLTSLMNGIDIYSLSRLLGHTSILTTQRYLESLTDETLSERANSSSPLMNMERKS